MGAGQPQVTSCSRLVGGLLVGLAALAVYVATCCRVVSPVADAGELTAAALTLGIPHPPGYPVFVLLGHVFGWLPLEPAAFRINLMAAVFGAAGASMAYLAMLELGLEALVAAAAALTLAFSVAAWQSAVSGEFRSLQLFWLASWMALTFRWLRQPAAGLVRGMAVWAGIGLLIHYSDAVPCLVSLLVMLPVRRPGWPPFWQVLVGVLVGLLPVLYLPIRASQDPFLNWGEASTRAGLMWDLLRRGYGPTRLASSVAASDLGVATMMKQWLLACWNYFTPLGLLLAGVGMAVAWRTWRRPAIWLLVTMILMGPVFIDVAQPPDDPDFWAVLGRQLLAFWVSFGVLLAVGLGAVAARLGRARGLIVLLPLLVVAFNRPLCDLHTETIADCYGRDLLTNLAPQAVLFASTDPACATTEYLQAVEAVRPDVLVIDDQLLWSPWYRHQLSTRHAQELAAFDWSQLDKSHDPNPLVDWLGKKRPVYVDQPWPAIQDRLMEQGIVCQIATTSDEVVHFDPLPALRRLDQQVTAWQGTSRPVPDDRHDAETAFVRFIQRQYGLGYANLGASLGRRGFFNDARRVLVAALSLDPHSVPAHINLGYWYASREDWAHAIEQYQAAVQDDPSNVGALRALSEASAKAGRADDALRYKQMADRLEGH